MVRLITLSLKILLAVLVSFFMLEFLLLTFDDIVFRNMFHQYDPDSGYRVRPYVTWGHNQTNRFGFNDHDYPLQKEANTYRILILSDSFNWAGGPEGNYTALLERRFAAEFPHRRVEVINAGYPGTHTAEQFYTLRKFGLQYQPDLVVLGFFVGNDFYDANPSRRLIAVGGTLINIDTRNGKEWQLFGQPLVWQSRLYLFLQEQWTIREAQADGPEPIEYTEWYLALEKTRMQIANWDVAPNYEANKQYIFSYLLKMRDMLAEQNIQFLVEIGRAHV